MKIDILTLFPNMFDGFINESIIKRAINDKKVTINLIDYRKYTKLKNGQVDDTAFGGGAGVVIMVDPIVSALREIKTDKSHVILMDPKGILYKEEHAKRLKTYEHLIIICGHYEGIDERIKNYVDEVISIGGYVLTGGEIPAMAIIDSVVRLIPGVITDESLTNESFNDNLLDYPVYTKPRNFRGMEVPEVLINGNHKLINEFREEERKRITKEYRDDLL
jgi:tRNA (guanine37-N1)-methyltransferase